MEQTAAGINWGVVTAVASFIGSLGILIFNIGYSYSKLKEKPGKDEVHKIVSEKIKTHKEGCAYYPEVSGGKLEQAISGIEKRMESMDSKLDILIGNKH